MLRACTLAASLGLFVAAALANPGPPIPVPPIAAQQAITVAEQAFQQLPTPPEDPAGFFVQSVEYTDQGANGASTGEWAWRVTFIHPIRNDHSVVFRVGPDGRAVVVGGTE